MDSQPLNLCHIQPLRILMNRALILLNSIALLFLIHYRLSFFFHNPATASVPTVPWLLVFASELILGFIWLLGQAFRWRPVSRTAFPESLPADPLLPAVDVFICTADPEKEPTLEVMNTVISAMALDYPPEKLHVYLSDDGGSPVTLNGMREARRFAELWVPFCRKYGITQRCPEAYFSAAGDERRDFPTDELLEEDLVKKEYESFKERLRNESRKWLGESAGSCRDHPAFIQVIKSNENDDADEKIQMPLLVYVSREKRTSHAYHFKAGALNVLLRVSGVMSNSPFILVLDCDMSCNDASSARRAMCFHLDPKLSPSLAFVQFPQKFLTASKNDIYDSQIRSIFMVEWPGMDGLLGPIASGTCFYIQRLSLYATSPKDKDVLKRREDFGVSKEFMRSLSSNWKPNATNIGSDILVQEAQLLASCTYEDGSKWGQTVGFLYGSLVEDYLTSFNLHCKGWTSVYCNPERAQFLGNGTTRLNELLVQNTRWSCGLFEVAVSRFCPLLYGPPRMSLLQSMCYAELAFVPLAYCLPLWCLAIIPQLCLLHGIPIYPKVSSSYFFLYSFKFISSLSEHLYEVLISGGTVRKWMNEHRIWMIKSITGHFYGTLDALMMKTGLRNASFIPTNKVVDGEQIKRYKMDIFDFQGSAMFLAPMAGVVIFNFVSFAIGVGRVAAAGNWEEMFGQIFLCFHILLMSYPIVEGMVLRSDGGRFPGKITLLSAAFVLIFLYLESWVSTIV